MLTLALTLLAAANAMADRPRIHGLVLDAHHRLVLEQWGPVISIGLMMTRARPVGAAFADAIQDQSVWRTTHVEVLARVTSVVLETAAPNYLRNPGMRYRITVEGVGVEPEYVSINEVDAFNARKLIVEELGKLGARTEDHRREALHYGAFLCLSALVEAGAIPGYEIPASLWKRGVFETRVGEDGATLERKGLERSITLEKLQDKAGAGPAAPGPAGREATGGPRPGKE